MKLTMLVLACGFISGVWAEALAVPKNPISRDPKVHCQKKRVKVCDRRACQSKGCCWVWQNVCPD
jgi:hypothetical protein